MKMTRWAWTPGELEEVDEADSTFPLFHFSTFQCVSEYSSTFVPSAYPEGEN